MRPNWANAVLPSVKSPNRFPMPKSPPWEALLRRRGQVGKHLCRRLKTITSRISDPSGANNGEPMTIWAVKPLHEIVVPGTKPVKDDHPLQRFDLGMTI